MALEEAGGQGWRLRAQGTRPASSRGAILTASEGSSSRAVKGIALRVEMKNADVGGAAGEKSVGGVVTAATAAHG